jgi:geranylgeranyl pyrophosphate synthase
MELLKALNIASNLFSRFDEDHFYRYYPLVLGVFMEQDILDKLNRNLDIHLHSHLPNHSIRDVYTYAVFPPGKLFRPQLVNAIAKDFCHQDDYSIYSQWEHSLDHAYFASLVEIHHAYTLVHDDLPSMDNDMERRGKPSTHAKFGQWQALLAGDGLLNISYQLLKNISSNRTNTLIALVGHMLGPKGLIHGQVLDLAEEMTKDFSTLLHTHELKTGRLIQLSMVGSYLLLQNTKDGIPNYRTAVDLAKLGYSMGIVFQLLDDLTELVDEKLNEHEIVVSPWFNFTDLTYNELICRMEQIESLRNSYQLNNFSAVLKLYYSKIEAKVEAGRQNVMKHLNNVSIDQQQITAIEKLLKI